MYKIKHKKPKNFDYDLLVIGSGSGGTVAAHLSANEGKKVAIVEAEKIGGECPNFGCIPTKALLQSAEVYKTASEGARYGVRTSGLSLHYATIQDWKNRAVDHTGTEEGKQVLEHADIHVINGYAHFLDKWTVAVGSKRYTAKNFLIASGTKSSVPPIPGLAETGSITYREAIELLKPPKSLFIIGGGAIGCEFAELFGTFGTKIHIADMAPGLIAMEDKDVGIMLQSIFESRGMKVYTSSRIVRVFKKDPYKVVEFEHNGATHQVSVEEILLSTGKIPNTDLGLENAEVAYDRHGIKVNKLMQTSVKHIYAVGDVVGPYHFTHTAAYQSRIAAYNIFHDKNKKKADYRAVPRCIFVDPEIACVGVSEQELIDKKIAYQVGAVPISILGRSNTSGQNVGFVKVLANKKGKLLGASIVSPRAGEIVQELTLAIQKNMSAKDVSSTIHAFPTWAESVRMACNKIKCR